MGVDQPQAPPEAFAAGGISVGQAVAVHGTAFFTLSNEALMGLLIPLLAVQMHLDGGSLGALVAVGSVGPMVLALPGGALCDYFGDRRVLLVMGLGAVVTAALYPVAHSWWQLAVVQLFGGVFRSNSWVAAQSYAVRVVPDSQRRRFTGRFTFVASIGMLIAPVIAGWIIERAGVAAGFIFMAIWSSGVLVCAALLVELRIRRDSNAGSDVTIEADRAIPSAWQIARRSYGDALPLLARPMLLVLMLLTLLRLAGGAMNATFYPVHLHAVGFSAAAIGQLVALISAGGSAGALLAAPLVARSSGPLVLFGSITLGIALMAVIPLLHQTWPIVLMSLAHGICLGISLPMLLAGLARYSEPGERGLVLGLRSVFNRAGFLVVPLVLGYLVQWLGIPRAFLITGAGSIAAVLATWWLWRRFDRQREEDGR